MAATVACSGDNAKRNSAPYGPGDHCVHRDDPGAAGIHQAAQVPVITVGDVAAQLGCQAVSGDLKRNDGQGAARWHGQCGGAGRTAPSPRESGEGSITVRVTGLPSEPVTCTCRPDRHGSVHKRTGGGRAVLGLQRVHEG